MNKNALSSPIIPKFARFPLLLVIIFHFSSYLLTKLITENAVHYNLSTDIDKHIPFSPFFIIFYIAAYGQWIFSYIYHSRYSKENCYQLVTSDLLSKIICTLCFILLPTTIIRPDITDTGFFQDITRFVFFLDTPVNLFPSMHCLMSWLCFRSSRLIIKPTFAYSAFQLILSLFIFASTVFVKQHFFIDIVFGIAVAEICWFISKRFSVWQLFVKKRI